MFDLDLVHVTELCIAELVRRSFSCFHFRCQKVFFNDRKSNWHSIGFGRTTLMQKMMFDEDKQNIAKWLGVA